MISSIGGASQSKIAISQSKVSVHIEFPSLGDREGFQTTGEVRISKPDADGSQVETRLGKEALFNLIGIDVNTQPTLPDVVL